MLCEECKKRPATVHFAKIVNGEKTEKHLCEQCAKSTSDMFFDFSFEPSFSINHLLSGLLGSSKNTSPGLELPGTAKCSFCGMTLNEFSRDGKLGCGRCYDVFETQINPLLKRIHGSSFHTGKVPRRTGGELRLKRQIDELKAQLAEAVKKEEYEKAAHLRDKIKELEGQLNK
jgi:protein arginine kinase activator